MNAEALLAMSTDDVIDLGSMRDAKEFAELIRGSNPATLLEIVEELLVQHANTNGCVHKDGGEYDAAWIKARAVLVWMKKRAIQGKVVDLEHLGIWADL